MALWWHGVVVEVSCIVDHVPGSVVNTLGAPRPPGVGVRVRSRRADRTGGRTAHGLSGLGFRAGSRWWCGIVGFRWRIGVVVRLQAAGQCLEGSFEAVVHGVE